MRTSTKLRVGDRVKLITRRHGDHEANPVWGGSQGRIVGTIYKIDASTSYLPIKVRWSEKHTNSYYIEDLALMEPVMTIKDHFKEDLFKL